MSKHKNHRNGNEEMVSKPDNVLDLIIKGMKEEKYERLKYQMMMDLAKTDKEKEQIKYAYEDEGKHYKMFQYIYYQLTGEQIDIPLPEVKSYDIMRDAVEASINGELAAVDLYRKIQSMLPTLGLKDMLFEIITDEQEHATRFTYLYSMIKDNKK